MLESCGDRAMGTGHVTPQTGPCLLNLFPMQFHADYTDSFLVMEPGASLAACMPAVRAAPVQQEAKVTIYGPIRALGVEMLQEGRQHHPASLGTPLLAWGPAFSLARNL